MSFRRPKCVKLVCASLGQKLFGTVGGLGPESKCAFHLPTFSSSIWCSLIIFKPLTRLFPTALFGHHFNLLSRGFLFLLPTVTQLFLSPACWTRAKGCLRSLKINFSFPQGELLLFDEASHSQWACENISHKNRLMLSVRDSSVFMHLALNCSWFFSLLTRRT